MHSFSLHILKRIQSIILLSSVIHLAGEWRYILQKNIHISSKRLSLPVHQDLLLFPKSGWHYLFLSLKSAGYFFLYRRYHSFMILYSGGITMSLAPKNFSARRERCVKHLN